MKEELPPSWLTANQANRILRLLNCDHQPVIAGRNTLSELIEHCLEHLETDRLREKAKKRKPNKKARRS